LAAIAVPLAPAVLVPLLYLAVGAGRFAAKGSLSLESRLALMFTNLGHVPRQYFWDLVTVPRLALTQRQLTGDLDYARSDSWLVLALSLGVAAFLGWVGARLLGRRLSALGETRVPLSVPGSAAAGLAALALALVPPAAFYVVDRTFYTPSFAVSFLLSVFYEVALRSPRWVFSARTIACAGSLWMGALTLRELACFAEAWHVERQFLRASAVFASLPPNSYVVVDGLQDRIPSPYGKAAVWPADEFWGVAQGLKYLLGRDDLRFHTSRDARARDRPREEGLWYCYRWTPDVPSLTLREPAACGLAPP
jgi:hypothetical protein